MDNELFMNAGVSHLPEMTSLSPSSAMLNWVSMETQPADTSLLSRYLSRDYVFWEKSTEQSIFDSALSSLVSSPTPSNSHFSGGENFIIRELIGKLGNIGEMYGTSASNGNVSDSCYVTPMSSPPPRRMMATKTTLLAEISGDPGLAERAAMFSCFGSRSFNGRANSPFPNSSNGLVTANDKMPRVSSSPALKPLASQTPAGESSGESSRKRKAKTKLNSPSSVSPSKESEEKEDSVPKRSKKTEENDEKSKSIDPYKDYIHVRARRGQATDSHSLAERVRREKISERMKLLQDLVPGCNKVTGKALMLDEIINYVQSLQRQVEFLSMKLSSVNTRLDFNMDALVSKDIFPSSNNLSAIQTIWCRGFDKVIFEGDCQILVNIMQEKGEDISIMNICKDIKKWTKKFQDIRISHVSRTYNEAAHLLAKHGPPNNVFFSNCIYPPTWLTNCLYNDYICSR